MNNKGLTLVELLAVITILGIIAVIVVPRVYNYTLESNIRALKSTYDMVVRSGERYVVDNDYIYTREFGDSVEVPIRTLQDEGILSGIDSPFNDNPCSGYLLITKLTNVVDYTPMLSCEYDIDDSITDGLIGYWKLDDSVIDVSPNNNHGTFYRGLDEIDMMRDPTEGPMELSRSDQEWIDFGNLRGAGITTLSVWFNTDRTSSQYLFEGRESGNFWFLLFYNDTDINFHNRVGYNGLELNEWYHVVVTATSDETKLYVNGKHVDTGSGISLNLSSLRFGTRFTNSSYFSGMINNARVYDRVLSDDEIRMLYYLER